MGDRVKRVIAAVIDWNISCIPALIVALIAVKVIGRNVMVNLLMGFLLVLCGFGIYALLILRDVIFGGRSIGKRIFGLYIVDEAALQPARTGKRAVKNVLNLITPVMMVDVFVLLASGRTLGERISHTRVVSKRTWERAMAGEDVTPQVTTRSIITTVAVAAGLFVLFIFVIVAVVSFSVYALLDAQQDTPEYALAYEYLISSEKYADVDTDSIHLNSYNSNTVNGERTVTYGFAIPGRYHTVEITLHDENGAWAVCEECTAFH